MGYQNVLSLLPDNNVINYITFNYNGYLIKEIPLYDTKTVEITEMEIIDF